LLPILRRGFSPTPKAQIPAQGCYRFLLPMLAAQFFTYAEGANSSPGLLPLFVTHVAA
jgi:hypothetical protein